MVQEERRERGEPTDQPTDRRIDGLWIGGEGNLPTDRRINGLVRRRGWGREGGCLEGWREG